MIWQGVRSGEQSCTELAKILRIRWCTMFQIISKIFLREGIQKKWKFLMTFANKKKRAVSSSIRFLSNIVLLIDIFFWDFLRHVRTGRSCFLSMLTWKPSTPRKLKGWGKPWRRLTSESFVVLRLLLLGWTPARAITSLGTTSGTMSGPTTLMKVNGLLEAPHPSRQKLRRFLSPWKPPFSLSLC